MGDSDDQRAAGRLGRVSRRGLLTGAAAAAAAGTVSVTQQHVLAQQPANLQPGSQAGAAQKRTGAQPAAPGHPIQISARPIASFERLNPSRRTHGRLEFRGGLALTAPHSAFGGWSGLLVSDDSRRMLAVSDKGTWLSAEIQYEAGPGSGGPGAGGGRPMALAGAMLGEIPGQGGAALRGRDSDAESISLLEGTLARGTVLIAFERNHRIGRYPVSDRGIGPPLGFLKMPADARRMSSNKGLEAVCAVRSGPLKGAVIAFSEELHDAQRNHTGWIWPTLGSEALPLGLTNSGDFAVTDLAALPDGNLIVLERKFRWLEGVKMRLRLINAALVKPGALLDGEVLLEADMASEIDNMEGLALSRDARGQTVLTLISDDNFNKVWQRTILLQFTLGAAATAGRAPTKL